LKFLKIIYKFLHQQINNTKGNQEKKLNSATKSIPPTVTNLSQHDKLRDNIVGDLANGTHLDSSDIDDGILGENSDADSG
jgi:hypothetical protein